MNKFQKKLKAVMKTIEAIKVRGYSDRVGLEMVLERVDLPNLILAANKIEYAEEVFWLNYWFGQMRSRFVRRSEDQWYIALNNMEIKAANLKALN